jgi:hypothetical protein
MAEGGSGLNAVRNVVQYHRMAAANHRLFLGPAHPETVNAELAAALVSARADDRMYPLASLLAARTDVLKYRGPGSRAAALLGILATSALIEWEEPAAAALLAARVESESFLARGPADSLAVRAGLMRSRALSEAGDLAAAVTALLKIRDSILAAPAPGADLPVAGIPEAGRPARDLPEAEPAEARLPGSDEPGRSQSEAAVTAGGGRGYRFIAAFRDSSAYSRAADDIAAVQVTADVLLAADDRAGAVALHTKALEAALKAFGAGHRLAAVSHGALERINAGD